MAIRSGISTFALLRKSAIGSGSAGGTSLSDPISLMDSNYNNNFSLSYTVIPAGGVGTAATVNFTYQIGPTQDGPFAAPITDDKGTIGTAGSGAAGSNGVIGFTPVIAPWMKIKAVAGTSGTALVTANLHVQ